MNKHMPGRILTVLMALVMVFLDVRLYTSQLLPTKLVILIAVFLLVLLVIVCLLLWDVKRFGRFIGGCVLFLVVTCGMAGGAYFLHTTLGTLDRIAGSSQVQTTHVSVYALSSDISTLEDLIGKNVGISTIGNSTEAHATLEDIEKQIGTTLQVEEYTTLSAMAEDLVNGNIDAMIMNEAFLSLLIENEGFQDLESRLHLVTKIRMEKPVATTTPTKPAEMEPEEDEGQCFVMYISGVDTRTALTDVSRSDSNILAVVNTATHQVLLVSTPRDYYVPLSISDGRKDKLTHAGLYGVEVSMDTLAMLYDVDVDYYFKVDFSGFKQIVDALDGITVYSDQEFWTTYEGYYYDEGNNDVDGEYALAFARERYAFADGDNHRGRNQMEVIKGIIRKAVSPSILSNYKDLLSALEGSFVMSVPYDVLASVVRNQLESGGDWNIVSYSVAGSGNMCTTYSTPYQELYVMDPDYDTVDHARELIDQVLDGQTLTQE